MKSILDFLSRPIGNLKILQKLMFIYVFGGLIPLLAVIIILSSNTRTMLIDRAISEINVNTERTEERLREVFEIAVDVSDTLYSDEQLSSIINTNYVEHMAVIRDFNAYTRMDDFLRLYSEIDSIRIYVDNDTLLSDSQIIKTNESLKTENWYQIAVENAGRMVLIYKYDEYDRKEQLAIVRQVLDRNREHLGVLVINISENYLNGIIASEPYDVYLVMNNEDIIVTNDTSSTGRVLKDSKHIYAFASSGIGLSDVAYNDTDYKVIANTFEVDSIASQFKLVTAFPVLALMENANDSVTTIFLLVGISLIVSISMVYFLSYAFSKRLRSFRRDMHDVAEGNLDNESNIDGNDELGELSNDLNSLTANLKSMIHEVYEAQIQKEQLAGKQKEAQFKMLASQINPHFLYNTLETIRMKAHIGGDKDIAIVVKKLAKIMRRNLSIKNDEVPLGDELELVRHYLEIQQFRFGEKVSFEFDIQCKVDNYKVLPLLLQPLVENAFVHGLERKIGNGLINIRIYDTAHGLNIIVEDNGVGIPSDKLKYLREQLSDETQSIDGSIGLANVNQRLLIYYGRKCRLDITSTVNEGTVIFMYLPFEKEGL